MIIIKLILIIPLLLEMILWTFPEYFDIIKKILAIYYVFQ